HFLPPIFLSFIFLSFIRPSVICGSSFSCFPCAVVHYQPETILPAPSSGENHGPHHTPHVWNRRPGFVVHLLDAGNAVHGRCVWQRDPTRDGALVGRLE